MSHLTYSSYEGFGERAKENTWYSQAVRIGDVIECSGQGGWNRDTDEIPEDFDEQVRRAFDNVEWNLKTAGARGWEDVYSIRIYALSMDSSHMIPLIEQLKKYCPNHQPILTGVAVKELAFGMKVEIEVKAHVGEVEGGKQGRVA